jgi:hypothetical protein
VLCPPHAPTMTTTSTSGRNRPDGRRSVPFIDRHSRGPMDRMTAATCGAVAEARQPRLSRGADNHMVVKSPSVSVVLRSACCQGLITTLGYRRVDYRRVIDGIDLRGPARVSPSARGRGCHDRGRKRNVPRHARPATSR